MTKTQTSWAFRLSTLPIRTKLTLVSALVMLALIALPSLSLYRDTTIRNINQTRLAIVSLDSMLLELQRDQNDFVNVFELKYLDKFSLTFEKFVESTENLKQQFWDLNLPIDTLEQLVMLTSDYQYLFEVMAEQKILIGQDYTKGIRKEINLGLKTIDEALRAVPNDDNLRQSLQNELVLLRLPVQELQVRHQGTQIDIFETQFTKIEKTAHFRITDLAIRSTFMSALIKFRKDVRALNTATQTVGLTYDDGLNGEISLIVNAAHQILNRLNTEVNAAIDVRENNLNTLLSAMAGFFLIAFVLTISMLYRSISVPIRNVTSIMTRLADGDLAFNIPDHPRRDEIGDMFRALRVFKMGAIIRQRTQIALRTAHDELENRVEERTRELSEEVEEHRLTEKMLMHAREDAESANQAKSQFLANMSHELRTPLNAIIGYAEMLQEDAEDAGNDVLSDDLGKIRSAGRHLLGIISEILDLSKIEAGHVDIYVEHFVIQDVIDTVADTVRPLIATNDNTFVIDIHDNAGDMDSDITRLRQILLNFLSNAAKFTDHGTITLSVWREPKAEGDTIVFSVADDGIGMNEEQQSHVFDPFIQADVSTTRKYGGTGLGLTINREFARHLGGEVRVESSTNKGTTFFVHLPAKAPLEPHMGEGI